MQLSIVWKTFHPSWCLIQLFLPNGAGARLRWQLKECLTIENVCKIRQTSNRRRKREPLRSRVHQNGLSVPLLLTLKVNRFNNGVYQSLTSDKRVCRVVKSLLLEHLLYFMPGIMFALHSTQ